MFGCVKFERICFDKVVNKNSETTCFIFLKDYLMKISIVCALVMLLTSSAYAQQTESIQQQKQQRHMKQREEGMQKTIKASPQVNIEKVEESEQPSGDN
jgi:hemolysin activation/secretion protein